MKRLKKIYGKVFSDETFSSIYKLIDKGFISDLRSIIKEGKESVVVSGEDRNGNILALKIYRIEYCDFKRMWNILVSDKRYFKIKKTRYNVVLKWAEREFNNMKIALEANINMPTPITFLNNILVMSFLGVEGKPFPRLIEFKELDEPEKVFYNILEDVKKLLNINLIHGDLSAYNILFDGEKHYIIDFSHATTKENILWKSILKRDLESLFSYFRKFLKIDEEGIVKEFLE